MSTDRDRERYLAAAHGMQSGVAMARSYEERDGVPEEQRETGPKHLRVGVNSAMSDHGALVSLLVEKGVFTDAEYVARIADFMEREREAYEKRISARSGAKVTLG